MGSFFFPVHSPPVEGACAAPTIEDIEPSVMKLLRTFFKKPTSHSVFQDLHKWRTSQAANTGHLDIYVIRCHLYSSLAHTSTEPKLWTQGSAVYGQPGNSSWSNLFARNRKTPPPRPLDPSHCISRAVGRATHGISSSARHARPRRSRGARRGGRRGGGRGGGRSGAPRLGGGRSGAPRLCPPPTAPAPTCAGGGGLGRS